MSEQCRIKGGAKGAATPGPAILGARNWWEWKNFYVLYITETCKIYKLYVCTRGTVGIEPTSPWSQK